MWSKLFRLLEAVRRAVSAFVVLLVLGALIAAVMSARPSVPERAVLVIHPKGQLVEELAEPEAALPFSVPNPEQTRISDLVRAIREGKRDARIRALLLDPCEMDAAPLEKLRVVANAIEDFKRSGKPVFAVGDAYTQSQYYLAATADRIWLHPMGMVLLTGIGLYRHYMKDALDRLHVRVHLFRAGKFKSAAEPLVRNDMSPAARQADARLASQIWRAWKTDVAQRRHLRTDTIQRILDDPAGALARHGNDPARLAHDMKLVDALATSAEAKRQIARRLKFDADAGLPTVDAGEYLRALGPPPTPDGNRRVGLIVASGPIVDGEAAPGAIGGDSLAALLDKAKENPHIKAVVLRIDSPGGSAGASETIRRAILRLKQSGKPVVVSMGSVAASGGYWMASAADEIWASPVTLTGSIGVFALMPEIADALEAVGVHTDGLATTKTAAGTRADRPLSPEVAAALQARVDHVYDAFIRHVAEGRHLRAEAVRAVAAGRVWTGRDALARKLVDHLGELPDAIAAAAKRANLGANYAVQRIRPKRTLRDRLLEAMLGKARTLAARIWPEQALLQRLTARTLAHLPPLTVVASNAPAILAWSNIGTM